MTLRLKTVLFITGILAYALLGVCVVNALTATLTEEYYTLMSAKALDIATITAAQFEISDAEVAQLKALEFSELREHPVNKQLSDLFRAGSFSKDLKYAYIMTELNPNEIKYTVTPETAAYYGAPVGTPLNLLWLADAIVGPEELAEAEADAGYYDDINRYSLMREVDIKPYHTQESASVLTEDEYGTAFSGLVPLYSTEGNFVGLMGVDIYFERFTERESHIRNMMFVVFLIPSIVLSVVYFIFFITKLRSSSRSANIDELTGLYNRRYFNKVLPQLVKEASEKGYSLSSIMIDIDHFKYYNDHYGHLKGDKVISAVAEAISSVVRHKTDVVFRYGGEELIVLLQNSTKEGALHVAQRIQTQVNNLNILHEFSPVASYLTVSQGIYSQKPLPGDNPNLYIVYADQALYRAKELGRNRYELFRPPPA